jgi:hypothetical protein
MKEILLMKMHTGCLEQNWNTGVCRTMDIDMSGVGMDSKLKDTIEICKNDYIFK